mgnify:CR=1 FL=1
MCQAPLEFRGLVLQGIKLLFQQVEFIFQGSVAEFLQVARKVTAAEMKEEEKALELEATHRPTLDDVFVHLTGRSLRDA